MKLSYFYPLIGHVVITLGIGFGYVIPGSCIAGLTALTFGFVLSVVAACAAYWLGIRIAVRDRRTG